MIRKEYAICNEIKEALKREDAFLNEAQEKTSLVKEATGLVQRGIPPGGFQVAYGEKKEVMKKVSMWRERRAKWKVSGEERMEEITRRLMKEWEVVQEKSPEVMVKRKNRMDVLKEEERREKEEERRKEKERREKEEKERREKGEKE